MFVAIGNSADFSYPKASFPLMKYSLKSTDMRESIKIYFVDPD